MILKLETLQIGEVPKKNHKSQIGLLQLYSIQQTVWAQQNKMGDVHELKLLY